MSVNQLEFLVWWIPQVPMKPFKVKVGSREEGLRLCEILADYDQFQFENKIKPDYANSGGVMFKHPVITENEWWEVPDESEWQDFLDELEDYEDDPA